jgi:hypothetical protein
MRFKNLDGGTARWVQGVQEYNFISGYRQGRKHKYADALSRRPCQEERTHCHKVELRADIKQVQDISALHAAEWDPLVLRNRTAIRHRHRAILQEVETGRRPEWKDIADRIPTNKSYWAQWE